ncbi:MAG TPA: hypothetical protein VFL64_20190 [Rhizobacter sp.]|nr:hypothetical protein [Rhizobacter sp.]
MSTDMSTDIERLSEADACHDAEPLRGAALLRQIDATQLPAERRPRLAFLLNHVLGEKLLAWPEALQRQQQLIALAQPAPPLVLWRQLGSAALVADAGAPLALAADALVAGSGASAERVQELLALSAAMYLMPSRPAGEAGVGALKALVPFDAIHWPTGSALDAQAAACANNLANDLLSRPEAELQNAPLRAALANGAEIALRLWQAAGTWVQQERALYLRALACTALGEPHGTRRHALAGLALLDAHDSAHEENVDRAFLELERWNACQWLGMADEAHGALTRAEVLAAQFNDAGLTDWFEGRRRKLPSFRR